MTENPTIARAIGALRVDRTNITFRGCENARLNVSEFSDGETRNYVITYPSGIPVEELLAPVMHEVAHIAQLQDAGGLKHLISLNMGQSKKIELGADFLVGYIARIELKYLQLNSFEQNMLVHGLYTEEAQKAHGRPDQRTVAFRRAVFGSDLGPPTLPVREVMRIYRDEIYDPLN